MCLDVYSTNMSNQKTETVDNTTTKDIGESDLSSSSRRSSGPPSWSQLLNKFTRETKLDSLGSKTIGYVAGILTLGFGTTLLPIIGFSIPGGWIMATFLVTMFSGVIGQKDYIASGLAGAGLVSVMALLSGAIFTFLMFGLMGAVAGMAGMAIGDFISDE